MDKTSRFSWDRQAFQRAGQVKIQSIIYSFVIFATACGTKNHATLKTATNRSPPPEIIAQFEKSFARQYEARQCFDNTRRFLQDVQKISDDTWYLVTVENRGFSGFGMINAELARNAGTSPEEKNWYHHVFALDEDGFVYDLDFTNRPKILPIKTYLEEMFLNELECKSPKSGEMCVGKDEKLRYYLFSL